MSYDNFCFKQRENQVNLNDLSDRRHKQPNDESMFGSFPYQFQRFRYWALCLFLCNKRLLSYRLGKCNQHTSTLTSSLKIYLLREIVKIINKNSKPSLISKKFRDTRAKLKDFLFFYFVFFPVSPFNHTTTT